MEHSEFCPKYHEERHACGCDFGEGAEVPTSTYCSGCSFKVCIGTNAFGPCPNYVERRGWGFFSIFAPLVGVVLLILFAVSCG